MYVGSAQARAVIREYEFYFLKRKSKNKKSVHNSGESNQDRIKFDVLLTSNEMINLRLSIIETNILGVNGKLLWPVEYFSYSVFYCY